MKDLANVSKTELAEAYTKLKSRTQKAQDAAKKEGEALIEDALTIGAGAGLQYYMGMLEAQADSDSEEDIKAKQQVMGLDIDLVVGGAATVAGMMKLGGKMSDTVRAVGVGALTSYAGRMAYEAGLESQEESE